MKHVDQERLERWLIRKTTQEKRKGIHPVKPTTITGKTLSCMLRGMQLENRITIASAA